MRLDRSGSRGQEKQLRHYGMELARRALESCLILVTALASKDEVMRKKTARRLPKKITWQASGNLSPERTIDLSKLDEGLLGRATPEEMKRLRDAMVLRKKMGYHAFRQARPEWGIYIPTPEGKYWRAKRNRRAS